MNFRLASESDFLQLAQLRWIWRADDGEVPVVSNDEFTLEFVQFLRTGLETGTRAYWIAEIDGVVISQIFVQKIDLVPRPCKVRDQCGSVTNSYTKPEYRGQGIGAQLLSRAIEWARDQDFELLIVWPSDEAIGFYERAGFVKENEIMELRLRSY